MRPSWKIRIQPLPFEVFRIATNQVRDVAIQPQLVHERRQYLKNVSLVLLTRGERQRMVIYVPPGAKRDKTHSPGFYEGLSQYLTDMGVPQV